MIGSALLPALLAALDAFFRARRRRIPVGRWALWLAVATVPLLAAWLWLRGLGATGLIEAPDGPILPERFPLETSGIVAMASAVVAGALACWCARVLAGLVQGRARPAEDSRRARPAPGAEGLAVATGAWLCALVAVAWVINPYAAGLLLVAAHLWLFAAGGWRGRTALAALAIGLVPPVLVVVHYGFALDLGPVDLVWGASLAAAAGAGLWSVALLAGLLAALAGAVRVVFARRRLARETDADGRPISTRGPVTYAGPGSLGGTESALRR